MLNLHLPLHLDQCQHFYTIFYTLAHLPYHVDGVFYKIKCDKLIQIMPCHKKMWLHILLIMHLVYEQIRFRGIFLRCNFYIYPLFLRWITFHLPCLCGRVQYQYYLLFSQYPLSIITQPLSWNGCQTLQYYSYYKNNFLTVILEFEDEYIIFKKLYLQTLQKLAIALSSQCTLIVILSFVFHTVAHDFFMLLMSPLCICTLPLYSPHISGVFPFFPKFKKKKKWKWAIIHVRQTMYC